MDAETQHQAMTLVVAADEISTGLVDLLDAVRRALPDDEALELIYGDANRVMDAIERFREAKGWAA